MRSGDERDAVGLEQRAGRAPGRARRRRRERSTTACARVAVDAVELRHVPAGRRSHSARSAASPSARAADSGYGKRRRRTRSSVGRRALGAHHDREHRLVGCARLDGAADRGGDLVGARDDRRHEEHDQRVEARVGEQQRERRLVGRAGRRAEQVDRVRDARLAGKDRGAARRASPASSSGSSSPAASQASAQRIPSPPAFVSTPTRRPRGQRLAREQAGDVDELLERPRAEHAGLVEERVDRRLRAGERGGVRARGARAGAVAPAFSARIGLRRATRRASRAELARVAERLEVEQDEIRLRVVLPPLEQVVRGDVRLVPDRDEGREAEPRSAPSRAARARARRSATRSRSGPAAARAARRSRSAAASRRRCRGSSGRPAGRRARGRARAAAPAARRPRRRSRRSRTRSRRARGRPCPAPPRPPRAPAAPGRQITARSTGVRDLRDRAVAAHAGDRLAAAVDRVGGAGEVGLEHVAEELAADRAAPARGADHGHARGSKNGRSEAATATWSRSSTRARNASVAAIGKLHLDLAVLELARDLEAGPGEDAEHRLVLGQHLGDEPRRCRSRPRARRAARAAACRCRAPAPRRRRRTRPRPPRVAQARVVRERDDALAEPARRARPSRPSPGRGAAPRARRSTLPDAVEAQVEAALGEALRRTRARRPRPRRPGAAAAACRRPGG